MTTNIYSLAVVIRTYHACAAPSPRPPPRARILVLGVNYGTHVQKDLHWNIACNKEKLEATYTPVNKGMVT